MKNNIVTKLLNLLETKGSNIQYGNENVTELEHALQCAELAEKNNFSKEDEAAVKEQFNDLLKIAGLSIPALVPLMKFTIPFIVKLGEKLGVNICPVPSGWNTVVSLTSPILNVRTLVPIFIPRKSTAIPK